MSKLIAGAKPWQLVVIGLGLAGAVGAAYFIGTQDEVKLKHEVVLADVTTGELFTVSTKSRAVVMPEINPVSGKATLVRVAKSSSGKWIANSQDVGALAEDIDRSALAGEEIRAKGEPQSLTFK